MADQETDDAILGHLLDAGYSPEQAASTLHQMKNEPEGIPGERLYQDPGAAAIPPLLNAGAVATGGFAARSALRLGLAKGVVPKIFSKIPGPVVSGIGQGTAEFAGSMIQNPRDPIQAFKNAMTVGGAGMVGEGVPNLLARAGATVSDIPTSTMTSTLERNPIAQARLMIGKPEPQAARNMAKAFKSMLYPEERIPGDINLKYKTPARGAAERQLSKFDRANPPTTDAYGVSTTKPIDTEPLRRKIMGMVQSDSTEASQMSTNRMLMDEADALPNSMTANELDRFIRQRDKPIRKTYGTEQEASLAMARKGVAAAARKLRDTEIPSAANFYAKASAQLDAMRKARNLIMTSRGDLKGSASKVIKGILNNEDARDVVMEYEKQTGHSVLPAWDDLARKTQWTKDDIGKAGNLFYVLERGLGHFVRPITKGLVLASQPIGAFAAASTAYTKSMQQEKQRQAFEDAMRNSP